MAASFFVVPTWTYQQQLFVLVSSRSSASSTDCRGVDTALLAASAFDFFHHAQLIVLIVRQRRRPARLAHGDEHLQKAAAQRQKSPCLAEICEPPTLGRVAPRWNGSCSAQRACGDGQVCWQALFWWRPQSQTVAAHPQPPPPQPVQTQLNVQCHWPPRRMSTRAAGQPGCRSPRNRNAGGMYRAQ